MEYGYWVISNNAVLTVVGIDYGIEETLYLRLNDEPILERIVQFKETGETFVEIDGIEFMLQDCMRV